MTKIIEIRKMEMSDLRRLCIANEWCTLCTEEQYDKLLKMTKAETITTARMARMADHIMKYSVEVAEERGLTGIMYDLACICYTIFEEVSA